MIFLAEKMWKTNFPSVKGGTGLKIIFPPFFLAIFQGPILVLVWKCFAAKTWGPIREGDSVLAPKPLSQWESGSHLGLLLTWRRNLQVMISAKSSLSWSGHGQLSSCLKIVFLRIIQETFKYCELAIVGSFSTKTFVVFYLIICKT